MESIGIILIIILAIASSLNKRAARNREAAKKQSPAQRQQPQGPFQQAMRQFQEAVEKAAGMEPEKKPEPAKVQQTAEKAAFTEADTWSERGFRGSIIMEEKPFSERMPPVRSVKPKVTAPVKQPRAAAVSSKGILPRMAPDSLVQAVVTHEILTRPRSAWQPRRETARKAAPGA